MPIHTGFADVNGTRLYYELAGAGHPLVLSHGFTLDTRMWDDQFAVFAQRYQVLWYDLRGFGKSAVPTDAPYTHPDDLHALMAHLGIAHAYIIGLSLGGAVAVDFAVTYPEATDALIPVMLPCSGAISGREMSIGIVCSCLRRHRRQGFRQPKPSGCSIRSLHQPVNSPPWRHGWRRWSQTTPAGICLTRTLDRCSIRQRYSTWGPFPPQPWSLSESRMSWTFIALRTSSNTASLVPLRSLCQAWGIWRIWKTRHDLMR